MADETLQIEQAAEETVVDTVETAVEEKPDFSWQTIEIVVPEQEPVEPTQDEVILKRKKDLQYKVAIGTATTTEKADLKLLLG